jgi:hypothetical protein
VHINNIEHSEVVVAGQKVPMSKTYRQGLFNLLGISNNNLKVNGEWWAIPTIHHSSFIITPVPFQKSIAPSYWA